MVTNLSVKLHDCPRCGRADCRRHSIGYRRPRDFGGPGRPAVPVAVSKHYCPDCRKHFTRPIPLSPRGGRYTRRVYDAVLDRARDPALTLEQIQLHLMADHGLRVPTTTIHDWVHGDCPVEN